MSDPFLYLLFADYFLFAVLLDGNCDRCGSESADDQIVVWKQKCGDLDGDCLSMECCDGLICDTTSNICQYQVIEENTRISRGVSENHNNFMDDLTKEASTGNTISYFMVPLELGIAIIGLMAVLIIWNVILNIAYFKRKGNY